MNCPSCKQKLNLRRDPAGNVDGVSCPRCEREWRSERVREIYNHCHDSMIRQITGIVNHMDFSDDCQETSR